jgi:DNA-binding response OmpR family regulator
LNFEAPTSGVLATAERRTQQLEAPPSLASRVLIVEDDEVLARFLERYLQAEGFQTDRAHDGALVEEALRSQPDLVLLDLNLPNLDGIQILQRVRPAYPRVPVLVLTGRTRSESAALSLENGADDCLTKPFSCIELVARIRALLRRSKGPKSHISQCADLRLDRDQMRVERSGSRLELTPREYKLLECLMRSPATPCSRDLLQREVWGEKETASSNVVDVYMKYVRDKVDLPGMLKLIHTVRGVGYVVRES